MILDLDFCRLSNYSLGWLFDQVGCKYKRRMPTGGLKLGWEVAYNIQSDLINVDFLANAKLQV